MTGADCGPNRCPTKLCSLTRTFWVVVVWFTDTLWANLCWRHCLHYSSLAYHLTHRSRGRIYELKAKVAICAIFSSLEATLKEISAIKNSEIAGGKKVNEPYILCNFFRREFLRNHSVYWAQIFTDNLNCYVLSVFRVFILLASSDSDKRMLMRQKV